MTYFTPVIDKYFAYWLIHSTWNTDQDIEVNFWRFIIALNRYSVDFYEQIKIQAGF